MSYEYWVDANLFVEAMKDLMDKSKPKGIDSEISLLVREEIEKHTHTWIPYRGLTEVYKYCECGSKSNDIREL